MNVVAQVFHFLTFLASQEMARSKLSTLALLQVLFSQLDTSDKQNCKIYLSVLTDLIEG
jgi:hypothetical protein